MGRGMMRGPGGGRGGPGMRQSAKPRDVKKTIKRLLSYLGKYKWQLPLVCVCILVSSLAGVAGTYFLRPIFNTLEGFIGVANPDLSGFIATLFMLAAVYLVGVGCSYAYSRIMLSISTDVLFRIRRELFEHMQTLPLRYYDAHTHGELMSHFTNDIDTLRQMVSQSLPQMFSSAVTLAGVFAMMLYLSPLLTALAIAMLLVMLFAVSKIGKKSAGFFSKQQKTLGAVNGYIEEMISGQKVVKVFCHEDKVGEEFSRLNEELRKTSSLAQTFAMILMPIMSNLSYVNYALTATVGGVLAMRGIMDIGSIASFLEYTRTFGRPITQLSQQVNYILAALAGAERIFAMLDEKPEPDEGKVALVNAREGSGGLEETSERTGVWAWKKPDGTLARVSGRVEFDEVYFGYEPEKTVLRGIDLVAEPGHKIALVGSTGAGKTTITNLINRFYDVENGSISYDGIPINDIEKDDLRRSLAVVLQDTHLFTGTVRENIRYGRLDATDGEVEAAARLANADGFIRHLAKGYDTVITGDGAGLSQGQRQLLSIARAAVADPPVLILDEATSSIDTRTEALIEKGMDSLMQGRTVFVIAHRLSTVRNANAIMVMENGEIIERGTHAELLEKKGKYYQLYTGAFELD